jgi:hypothetical protein
VEVNLVFSGFLYRSIVAPRLTHMDVIYLIPKLDQIFFLTNFDILTNSELSYERD